MLVTSALSVGAAVSLSGCLGDDDDDDDVTVPDATFEIVDMTVLNEPDGDDPGLTQITVQHVGEALTEDNTAEIEPRVAGERAIGGGYSVFAEGPLEEGDTLEFEGTAEQFASGVSVSFYWIDPSGEQEAELNEATVP